MDCQIDYTKPRFGLLRGGFTLDLSRGYLYPVGFEGVHMGAFGFIWMKLGSSRSIWVRDPHGFVSICTTPGPNRLLMHEPSRLSNQEVNRRIRKLLLEMSETRFETSPNASITEVGHA